MPSTSTEARRKYEHRNLAIRLRSFSAAVLGESNLKVGPHSIAALFEEAAAAFDKLTQPITRDKAGASFIAKNPNRYFIRQGGVLVRIPFQTAASAEEWAKENYKGRDNWAVVPPKRLAL